MRNGSVRRAGYRLSEAARETQWLVPAVGALLGGVLGLLIANIDVTPTGDSPPFTVDREREVMLAAIALLFTGLSIVLSISAVSAQNVANRFSLRLLGVMSRSLVDKAAIGTFVLALSYIIVVQVRIRSHSGEDPANPATLLVAVGLLVLCGIAILGQISRTIAWMRVDRSLQYVARQTCRTATTIDRAHQIDGSLPESLPAASLVPPSEATPLNAARGGYLDWIDTVELHELATRGRLTICINAHTGAPLVRGENIGWIASRSGVAPSQGSGVASLPFAAIDEAVEIADSRSPAHDIALGIRIMVDIALSALSPAVNDPYTAVQALDSMTIVLTELADRALGPRGKLGEDGAFTVAVAAATWADYLGLATTQIILDGGDEPTVNAALLRLAAQLERVASTNDDHAAISALREKILRAAPEHAQADQPSDSQPRRND